LFYHLFGKYNTEIVVMCLILYMFLNLTCCCKKCILTAGWHHMNQIEEKNWIRYKDLLYDKYNDWKYESFKLYCEDSNDMDEKLEYFGSEHKYLGYDFLKFLVSDKSVRF
jgi:hypothetical protein